MGGEVVIGGEVVMGGMCRDGGGRGFSRCVGGEWFGSILVMLMLLDVCVEYLHLMILNVCYVDLMFIF